jgi:hypothetical protein
MNNNHKNIINKQLNLQILDKIEIQNIKILLKSTINRKKYKNLLSKLIY